MSLPPVSEFSDDEIYFGKLTLKEVKRHIIYTKRKNRTNTAKLNDNNEINIIETHSVPDLSSKGNYCVPVKQSVSNIDLSPKTPELFSNWDVKNSNDSFLETEKILVEGNEDTKELDNTLDIINYILNNGPGDSDKSSNNRSDKNTIGQNCKNDEPIENAQLTPPKVSNVIIDDHLQKSTPYLTPRKKVISTPKLNKNTLTEKTPFKTPSNTISSKKCITSSQKKKSTLKNNTYDHIASPVAEYIKNCPVVPLVQNIRPTKTLPTSSIPKFTKTQLQCKFNKENVHLPTVAYKSAKKTQVINIPDIVKLPEGQRIQKLMSSLPRPVIMKHNQRVANHQNSGHGPKPEDSFIDLSLHQAEVSICTQNVATPRKHL